MESNLLFTLFYLLFSVCFVFPPQEFVAVGLTIDSLFSFLLKNEGDNFILHHIQRTSVTLVTHACLPLGYVLGLKYIMPEMPLFSSNFLWNSFVVASFVLPVVACLTVLHWWRSNWKNHPIVNNFKNFGYMEATNAAGHERQLNNIASDINREYRRVDKIIIRSNSITRIVGTDNWIIKISPYTVEFAHQSDASLVVSSSDTHLYVPGRPEGGQYLNIDVKSSRQNVRPFQIRINSADFRDLQEKMIRPISILENVVVHKTLTDEFLDVFKEQVEKNPKITAPDNLDVCIGCMQTTSNVKLMTSCGDTSGRDKCTMCYCRPLWCIECMGKWFGSRQDQDRPETWLSSKCTCPMCRSTFCILDVCKLVSSSDADNDNDNDS